MRRFYVRSRARDAAPWSRAWARWAAYAAVVCGLLLASSVDASDRPAGPASSGAAARVGTTAVSLSVQPAPAAFAPRADWAKLGRALFFDTGLSEPHGVSCASCHEPDKAFAGGRVGAAGTAAGSRRGHFAARAAPSLLYVRYAPPLYFYQDDDANAPEPRGGLFADGRSDGIAAAVVSPLLDADEMNNGNPARLARKLATSGHAEPLRRLFGDRVFDDPQQVLSAVGRAFDAYLSTDEMAPFNSRYDRFVRREAPLSDLEMRGLALFANPDKGNCASCHAFNPTSSNPARSLFTDYGYDAVAAPRNRALAANRDPAHFDLGICTTGVAKDWPDAAQWCGYFKTPSLRNVASRSRYMHNGVFDSLRQVVEFYASRATDPSHWYGKVKFNDLPASARGNVNINSVPYNRRAGSTPALDAGDIDAIVAFLKTLTDEPVDASARR